MSEPGCCRFPNGIILVAPCISSAVALLLSLQSAFTCLFVSRTELTSNFGQTYDLGLWSWGIITDPTSQSEGQCFRYGDNDPVDDVLEAARIFGIIAIVLGGILLTMTWVSTCLPLSKNMLLTLSVGYFLTCACEGLKLLIFNAGVCTHGINDYEWGKCKMGPGAHICVVSICIWFGGGFLSSIAYRQSDGLW